MLVNRRTAGAVALVSAGMLAISGASASASPPGASPSDPVEIIASVAPSGVDGAAAVRTSLRSDAAIGAAFGGTRVTVPVDPARGIDVGFDGRVVGIELPFDATASDAVVERPGIVSFDNGNGSTTVPVVLAGGGVKIHTVIDGPGAPARYSYDLDLPARATITTEADGALTILDKDGAPLGVVAAPWALDANGAAVPTRYEVAGTTVTQVVEHSTRHAYPVVADPEYWPPVTSYWSRDQVERNWKLLSYQSTLCMLPIPTSLMAACYSPATMSDAIASAHYQKKRIKQVYYGCKSGAYCNYTKYYVVS